MNFDDILVKYRTISFSERNKGTRFEQLMRAYLLTDPKYTAIFKNIFLWEEFFARTELGVVDTGIDLVAETVDGEFWAIQCKFYEEHTTIDKSDVDTFLSTSGRNFHTPDGQKVGFSVRLWISTSNRWTSNAENALHGQGIPVTRISLENLRNAPVDWKKLESGIHGEQAREKIHTLKEHQKVAVNRVCEHFKHAERGKLIMACGTGKTFVSLKVVEEMGSRLVLVLVPSIALVGQILREYTAHSLNTLNTICVCSDPKVSQSRIKNDDVSSFSTIDLTVPATTDSLKIAKLFKKYNNDNLTVIFSTYQSIEVLEKAQKQYYLPEFDVIICDEAHRTTGVTISEDKESAFVRVHDNNFIKSKKRLYMTATPRLYSEDSKAKAKRNDAVLCSMDDPEMYGEEIYRIGFGEAVEKGLLSDYKVLIFTVNENDVPPSFQETVAKKDKELPVDTAAKIIGCINAMSKQVWGNAREIVEKSDPAPMKQAVAFCSSIAMSKGITELFNELTQKYIDGMNLERKSKLVMVDAKHIDGTMNATKREELLNWLKTPDANSSNILSNVRCLSEGVDVPALDAIMFLSARNSQVDVVQSVGRVMRKAEGKKYGYIIIPIVIPPNVEPEIALDDNKAYQVVWSVLNALRAHDDRFNATINKIELNKKRPESILIGGVPPFDRDDWELGDAPETDLQISMGNFEELQNAIYARLVQKVGDRRYWEDWAKSVADIAGRQIENITKAVSSGATKQVFDTFLLEMRSSIDNSITEERAIEMLAQNTITAPVFDALFENYAFAKNNTISIAMNLMLDELRKKGGIEKEFEELKKFYESVRSRAAGIDNAKARQSVIIELYNTFFKTAFPKMTEQLGIVYTPVEVVDFIIQSANDVLEKEFGRKLTDKNVNIFDPFTGTGTFITRLIQSGLINKDDLSRKFKSELFANELVLLAYYIACVNIENTYHDIISSDEYVPFEGIALTDTFQAWEQNKPHLDLLDENSERIKRQNAAPITVIFSNPPYSVGQRSANDNAQNNSYPKLDEAIAENYAKLSDATNKNALYDSYIRAFRYATDRLDNGDGIISFVSNGAWLDGNATAGFRKSLENEFSKIYVFNLRGNQRTSGELSRREGGKIFGSGSRTPVSITLLVKKENHKGRAEIYYRDIGDYLKREEKLAILKDKKSFLNPDMELICLTPNEHGDWITTRNEAFQTFIPLASEKKFDINTQSMFVVNSRGFETARDAWIYNFSKEAVQTNMKNMVDFYNTQIGKLEPDYDKTKISWSRSLLNYHKNNQIINYEENKVAHALYRPFCQTYAYYGEKVINVRGQFDEFFPTADTKNLIIVMSSIGDNKDYSCLISNSFVDLHCVATTQCFPLYWYEEQETTGQASMFDTEQTGARHIRHDGVSDFILAQARERYGSAVKKEDIFFYVYGFLHSPKYRTTFADDLKKSLPRIPLMENAEDFWGFSKAGRELAELHLNYENLLPPDEVTAVGDRKNLKVQKMRFKAKDRKDSIIYNSNLVIENIPEKAYEYVVNGRSAI